MRVCCLAGKWGSDPASSQGNGSSTTCFCGSSSEPWGSRNGRQFSPSCLPGSSVSPVLRKHFTPPGRGDGKHSSYYQYSCTAAIPRPHSLLKCAISCSRAHPEWHRPWQCQAGIPGVLWVQTLSCHSRGQPGSSCFICLSPDPGPRRRASNVITLQAIAEVQILPFHWIYRQNFYLPPINAVINTCQDTAI